MLHPLSGSITGTGRAGYAALFNFIFTVRVLYCFLRREQALLTVGLKNLSHNAVLLFMICFCFDVAAFAVYGQSAIRPVESKLSPAVCHPVRAWLPYLAIRHAGISHPLRFCSMSRRSPYTSSLPFVRLRASSHRPSVILSVHGSLLTRKKNRLSFRTSGSLNSINCSQSVHSRMRANTPGSRCPLGPALKRHTLISHSALSAAGIIIRITSVG